MRKHYDVVVIGAGSGGLTSAVGFSKIGKKVLLVEREHMGGECTNSGCIPSKALLHHAKNYFHAKEISDETARSKNYRKSAFTYVRGKINEILEDETSEVFEKMGIDVVMGEAEFIGKCCIKVNPPSTSAGVALTDDIEYHFKKAVIATGSSPRMIEVEGLDTNKVLTNQNIFDLNEIPEKLLIIGSGPIGMEMGQAFAMLGSEVTIATIDSRFARLEDEAISPIIEKKFTDLNITILKNAYIKNVAGDMAHFDIKLDASNKKVETKERVRFDKILIAIGRVPNLPKGLEKVGVEYTEYGVTVNKNHRTKNKDVYAVGDVAQRLKFTHTADDAARHVVTHVVSRGFLRGNTRKAVPKVTYTEPEIAQVGLSFKDACKKYNSKEIMRIEVPYSLNDRAKTDSKTGGLMVVITRRLNGAILGANIIGNSAGEMIAVFTIAIDKKISMWGLRSVIYAYPTYSLLIKKAGDYFFAQQITSLKTDLFNLAKKHAPKIIALVFWGTLFYYFNNYRVSEGLSYQAITLELLNFFTGTIYGPFAYMILYAIRPLIFFPATLLTALSGALFGFWWGVLYTILGENASANFAYWIGRFFGRDLRLEDSFIGNWVEALRRRPFGAVLFMRLFYVPFDLTNYGSGILRVRWRPYFLATLIGIMPGLTTFVALGASVSLSEFEMNGLSFNAFDPKFLALSVSIFVGSLILSRYLKRWKPDIQ